MGFIFWLTSNTLVLLAWLSWAVSSGDGNACNSRLCEWDVPAGQQRSEFDFSCAKLGAVPGASAACGAVLLGQWGYRSPVVICMKRMSFAWLLGKEPCGSSVKGAFEHPERRVCIRMAYKITLVVQLWTAVLWVLCSYCGAYLEVPKFPFCMESSCCPGVSLEEEAIKKKLGKVHWLHFHVNPLWYLAIARWNFQASVLQTGICLVALHNWIVKFTFKLQSVWFELMGNLSSRKVCLWWQFVK